MSPRSLPPSPPFYDLDPRSLAPARRMVRDVMADRHLPLLAGDAMTVLSELITTPSGTPAPALRSR